MKKNILFLAGLSVMLGACQNEEVSENQDASMNLSEVVDLSEMASASDEMTVYLYPKDDAENLILHLTSEDYTNAKIPVNEYNAICFGCNTEEMTGFNFDMSSFDNASIKVTDNTILAGYGIEETRAYSANSTLIPQSIASGTRSLRPVVVADTTGTRAYSANGTLRPTSFTDHLRPVVVADTTGTRAYSATNTLKPHPVIRHASLVVTLNGTTEGSEVEYVSGTVSNLSAGVEITTGQTLSEAIDQELPVDCWSVSTDRSDTTLLVSDFGTFGIPTDEEAGTRAYSANGRLTPHNPIKSHFSVTFTDGTTKDVDVDLTDQIVEQLQKDSEDIILTVSVDL